MLPSITQCSNIRGKYVLVRASLNVPVHFGVVRNEFRIHRALPTLQWLRTQGARVIIVAHIGRKPTETLAPVATALQRYIPLTFVPATGGSAVVEAREQMRDGDIIMLENVRQHPHETDPNGSFGTSLAHLVDVYVNDAFAASHRAHASLVEVAQQAPSYFGVNFMHEYDALTRVMQPASPALFIIAGAKFDTKLPLIERYLDTYQHIFVGGALANDIFKARGYEVGTSLVSDIDLRQSALVTDSRIQVPIDVVVDGPDGRRTCRPDAVRPHESILDAGPETIAHLSPLVREAKTILWNGPLGNYEAGFGAQTEALAAMVAAAPGYSLIGGGDTIAAVEKLALQESISFMSTAGGAMLTFLEAGTLPAIDAIVGSN